MVYTVALCIFNKRSLHACCMQIVMKIVKKRPDFLQINKAVFKGVFISIDLVIETTHTSAKLLKPDVCAVNYLAANF